VQRECHAVKLKNQDVRIADAHLRGERAPQSGPADPEPPGRRRGHVASTSGPSVRIWQDRRRPRSLTVTPAAAQDISSRQELPILGWCLTPAERERKPATEGIGIRAAARHQAVNDDRVERTLCEIETQSPT